MVQLVTEGLWEKKWLSSGSWARGLLCLTDHSVIMSHRSLCEIYCFSPCPCFFSNTYVLYTIRKGFISHKVFTSPGDYIYDTKEDKECYRSIE